MEGGKGINVSIVLHNLGVDNIAWGFLAGFTGQQIECKLKERGCRTDFIFLSKGLSRINLKLQINGQEDTEINGGGPEISSQDLGTLLQKLESLRPGDILVLAGSLPSSLPKDTYDNILARTQNKSIVTIVDAAQDVLRGALAYHPFLIKPNKRELEELFGTAISGRRQIVSCARQLQVWGARNILVSLGREGALFFSEQGDIWDQKAPEGSVVQPSGAGDSMVAGFLAGLLRNGCTRDTLRLSVAAGSASAFSTQLATKEETERLYQKMAPGLSSALTDESSF